MKKAGILFVVVCLLASMLTACGCSANVSTDSSTTTVSQTTTTTRTTAPSTTTTVTTTTTAAPSSTPNDPGATQSSPSKDGENRGDDDLRRKDRIMPMR